MLGGIVCARWCALSGIVQSNGIEGRNRANISVGNEVKRRRTAGLDWRRLKEGRCGRCDRWSGARLQRRMDSRVLGGRLRETSAGIGDINAVGAEVNRRRAIKRVHP